LKTADGHQRVVRHGHLPEREVMTGIGPVSATDEYSWDTRVDSVPEGFKVIQSASGSNFLCATCDNPGTLMTPQRPDPLPLRWVLVPSLLILPKNAR
jgi:hypothetical protein